MNRQNTVSGTVLAGGQGRRMLQQDKGLLLFRNRPLVSYALAAMKPLVDELFISANRNVQIYRQLGFPVIEDDFGHFEGPLAGILRALRVCENPLLLILPCDLPLIETQHVQRLLEAMRNEIDIVVATDGQRLHPVFAMLRRSLADDLQQYLQSGERRLQQWFLRHRLVTVDFSDSLHIFTNLNTLQDLRAFE